MTYEEILYTTTGSVGYLTLNSPKKKCRFVLAIGKQGFYAQIDQPDAAAMHYAKHTITMNLSAEDAQGGIQAFLKKEKPIWKNR